jgi:hypothetical protein
MFIKITEIIGVCCETPSSVANCRGFKCHSRWCWTLNGLSNECYKGVIKHFLNTVRTWWMTNVMHKLFSMCFFLFITLYMFRAHSANHQEREFVSIHPLVTVILRKVIFQPAHVSATNIEWLLPETVLIQFVSPDDEHCVLETCRDL